jgi:hypothetical protein
MDDLKLAVYWLAACALSCGARSDESPLALDPGAAHYGKTYAEWAGDWVRWVCEMHLSQDCATPISDTTGALCTQFQNEESPCTFLPVTSAEPIKSKLPFTSRQRGKVCTGTGPQEKPKEPQAWDRGGAGIHRGPTQGWYSATVTSVLSM